jgi:hypothetical protein
MATKKKTETKTEFRVSRIWTVEYRSYSFVKATNAEEAARLALEDDDYSDQESCDGSDGPTEIDEIVEITPDGDEIEHDIPVADDAEYADVAWRVEDIKERMPDWSNKRCAKWLEKNADAIQVAMIDAGGDEIERSLPSE